MAGGARRSRTRSGSRRGRACRGSSSCSSPRRGSTRTRPSAAPSARASGPNGRSTSYVASLSFRTVTYKALCAADQLAAFYADLRDPALEIPFGIFHQRFSTNTAPSWERAQPFRALCHNGEINAIQGNVNWMRAREGRLGSDDDSLYAPVVDPGGSDSAMLDNVLELLVRGGRDVRHALAMLVPEAWEGNVELDPAVRDFYRYHSGLCEPWDGPAALVFTDGRVVGAALDRNGLRPLRYAVGGDLVVCASEAGVADLPEGPVRRGKLGPGEMLAVDPVRGLEENAALKRRLAARAPYGEWLERGLVRGSCGSPVAVPEEELTARQAAFGYTQEDLRAVMRPTAAHAHEPTSSMGDDAALPPLAGRARPLYAFFRQRFAQVTNPPIDHLRERFVFSLRTLLGDRSPILVESPEAAAGIELESFFLYPDALARLDAERIDATFAPEEGLVAALERVVAEAEASVRAGRGMLAALRRVRRPRPRARSRSCSPSAPSTSTSSPRSCGRSRPSSSRATSRARCTTSHACSATAPRRSAPAWRWRPWPRSPTPTSSAPTGPRPTRRRRATAGRSRRAS